MNTYNISHILVVLGAWYLVCIALHSSLYSNTHTHTRTRTHSVSALYLPIDADVRVSCLMCYHSLLSSGCDSEVRAWLSRCASPSLLHLFLDQLPPSPQPQVVQIASLQAMAAMAKHHAEFVV